MDQGIVRLLQSTPRQSKPVDWTQNANVESAFGSYVFQRSTSDNNNSNNDTNDNNNEHVQIRVAHYKTGLVMRTLDVRRHQVVTFSITDDNEVLVDGERLMIVERERKKSI
jgi:hypothetical protein